jgi:hypothetical protein
MHPDIDLDVQIDLKELAGQFDLMTPNQLIGIVTIRERIFCDHMIQFSQIKWLKKAKNVSLSLA